MSRPLALALGLDDMAPVGVTLGTEGHRANLARDANHFLEARIILEHGRTPLGWIVDVKMVPGAISSRDKLGL